MCHSLGFWFGARDVLGAPCLSFSDELYIDTNAYLLTLSEARLIEGNVVSLQMTVKVSLSFTPQLVSCATTCVGCAPIG